MGHLFCDAELDIFSVFVNVWKVNHRRFLRICVYH